MASVNSGLTAFNRGVVSPEVLGRVDIEKLRLAAETQTNWLPKVLGPMTLRPGLEYIDTTRSSAAMYPLKFVFSNSDTAILELTSGVMRVRLGSDESLVSFTTVSTTVTNGDFSSSTGWTLTSGGSSTAAISGGKLNLSGASSSGTAKCDRQVTVAGGDQNVRHCLKIVVDRGPVMFRAGTSAGDDSYITSTTLDTGTHYLELTPAGDFYVQFESSAFPLRIVDAITVFTGTLEITTPWTTDYLPYIRPEQSADVIFIACRGLLTMRIERRSARSWSLVDYKTDNGPFLKDFDETITITPSALKGNITLTANRKLFRSTHVGSLWRLFHDGQSVNSTLNALNDVTDAIRVTGVGVARIFQYSLTFNSFVGTIALQQSFEGPDSGFTDTASPAPFTSDTSFFLQDTFDNSVVWYRFKVTAYTSDSGAVATLSFPGGGGAGIARVTAFSTDTSVSAEVLTTFKNTTASTNWREGAWSEYRGFPTAAAIFEGRLFLASGDHIWGSESDDYTSFDFDATGDAAPIDRTIGYGPVDTINALLPLSRLGILREGSEIGARSSSLDEPLTPSNFNLKDISTLGSMRLPGLKVDTRGIFVQQSGKRIYDIGYSADAGDYRTGELTRLAPEICTDTVVALAVQRQPDTRLHFVLADGTVAVLVYDLQDDVIAWWTVETDGLVENVVVLPGVPEDKVYYVVKRGTSRYLERCARLDQCHGRPDARLADSHVIYDGVSTSTITGLDHLNGETVVAWGYANGATSGSDLGTYTVASGSITLSTPVVWACVGLGYSATFKSAKLAYGAQKGTALTQKKRAVQLGLIMRNTYYQGVEYGDSLSHMRSLPLIEGGQTTTAQVWEEFDAPMIPVASGWTTDSRLYLTASAPNPATVMAAVIQVDTNDR